MLTEKEKSKGIPVIIRAIIDAKNRPDSSRYSTSRSLNVLYILKNISRTRAIEQDSTPANPPLLRMATSLSRASVDRLKLQIAEELFIFVSCVFAQSVSETRMQRLLI